MVRAILGEPALTPLPFFRLATIGALAVTASQALHVTQRPAPPALVGLLNQIRSAAPVMREVGSPGVLAAAATAALRREMDIPG